MGVAKITCKAEWGRRTTEAECVIYNLQHWERIKEYAKKKEYAKIVFNPLLFVTWKYLVNFLF
jgi:hypothetical protein